MVRGIRDALVGSRLEEVVCCPCSRKPILLRPELAEIRERTRRRRIDEVTRLAKRVLIRLDSNDAFVIEPRMTGLMLLTDPPTAEHLRIRWDVRSGRRRRSVWFWDRRGLGTVQLYRAEELEVMLGPNKLGPDALGMTPRLWQERLARTSRPIKVALLDQKLVAGIGNLYASEILHAIRLSPFMPADQLTRAQIRKLHKATQQVLETAIRYEGSTLADGTYRNALNQNGGYQNEHRVYGKAGTPCPTCQRGDIERTVQAQRSTFYCPLCQRTP